MAAKVNPEGARTNDSSGDLTIAQLAPPMPLPWPRPGIDTADIDWKAILAALAASLTGVAASGGDQRQSQCRVQFCIYRNASETTDSLTPRPGTGDVDPRNSGRGLSFFDSLARLGSGKWIAINPALLVSLTAVNDNLLSGHWSVRPITQENLEAWAATRGTGLESPFTTEIRAAIVDRGRVP